MTDKTTDPATLALSLLAELPDTIAALSHKGGVVPLRMVSSDGESLIADIPADAAAPGTVLTVRLRDDEGYGHDVELRVDAVRSESERSCLVRLTPTAVERFAGDAPCGGSRDDRTGHRRI